MREPIRVQTIKGMNNASAGYDPEEPEFILNMDAFLNKLLVRDGYSQVASFTTCHSLQGFEDFLLCVGNGSGAQNLFKIDLDGTKQELATITGIEKVYSVKVNEKIYLSSKKWTQIYDQQLNSVSSWGVAIPTAAPIVSTASGGDLPSGLYGLCFTNVDVATGQRSGQGPITYIDVADGEVINISNLAANQEVWISSQGDPEFYYFSNRTNIVRLLGTTHLKSLDVIPAPKMEHLTHFLNRIWGTQDKKLFYSEAFALSWFKEENVIPFEDDIWMVAKDTSGQGLYIGTEKDVWFVSGVSISTLKAVRVGKGVIKDTLSYCDFNELQQVPVWFSSNGAFAGIGGELKKLTGRKLKYDKGVNGASFFREKNGEFQYGAVFTQPDVVVGDDVSVDIIKAGTIFTSTYDEFIRDGAQVSETIIGSFDFTNTESVTVSDSITVLQS